MLSHEAIAAEQQVSDEDIEAAYQDYQQQLAEDEQREASHILIEPSDDRTDEQARLMAQQLSERARAGESFAALAAAYSDDIGSKSEGGSLGIAAPDALADAFEQALGALAWAGCAHCPV